MWGQVRTSAALADGPHAAVRHCCCRCCLVLLLAIAAAAAVGMCSERPGGRLGAPLVMCPRPCFCCRQRLPGGSHGRDGGRHRRVAVQSCWQGGVLLPHRWCASCCQWPAPSAALVCTPHSAVPCAAGKVVGIEKHPELVEQVRHCCHWCCICCCCGSCCCCCCC